MDLIKNNSDKPYIVVPGTIEPRKNGRLVLEYLSNNKKFLEHYRVVFFGRKGWLINFENVIMEYGLGEFIENDSIVWMSFVSNEARDEIYRNAEFMIYPSLYEGFGLPVGEAMAQGCPVCASFSSSIPEVGGDIAIYFDPTSVDSLGRAINEIQSILKDNVADLKQKLVEQSNQFTWDGFYRKIIDKAQQLIGE